MKSVSLTLGSSDGHADQHGDLPSPLLIPLAGPEQPQNQQQAHQSRQTGPAYPQFQAPVQEQMMDVSVANDEEADV